jgi:hypothetical protein
MAPSLKLVLPLAASVLFVLALAYWWQGNLFHEIVGTIFIALLLAHNLSVLRWYGALGKGKWTGRRLHSTLVNLAVLTIMLALVVTSIMVSQRLYTFLPLNVGFSARDLHVLAGYWALIFMALHLGLHWSRVLARVKRVIPIDTILGTIILRAAAAAIALYGIYSSLVMLLGEKLLNVPALDMWDFNANAWGFFLHYASIVGLFACAGHYFAVWLQARR